MALSYADPLGLCRVTQDPDDDDALFTGGGYGAIGAESPFTEEALDEYQRSLQGPGMFPGVGAAFDGVNGTISLARGKPDEAAYYFFCIVGGRIISKTCDLLEELRAINWKGFSKGKLAEHFLKHGDEFGNITQNQYLKMAKKFAAEAGHFMEAQVGNFYVKYDPATRRALIGHIGTREVRTFYIADFRDADPFKAVIDIAKSLGE